MSTAVLEEIDGKLMLEVPRELRDELDLAAGDSVGLCHEEGQVTLTKTKQYSLEQLIAEHREIADQLEEDRAWIDAPRVGRELI